MSIATKKRSLPNNEDNQRYAQRNRDFIVEKFNPGADLYEFRSNFRLSREKFAHVLGYSSRSVANWEAGAPIASHAIRSIQELKSIYKRACNIAPADEVNRWFVTANDYLEGMTPLEAISVGKADSVLRIIILSEEGIPV